jgi:hypothetical protein
MKTAHRYLENKLFLSKWCVRHFLHWSLNNFAGSVVNTSLLKTCTVLVMIEEKLTLKQSIYVLLSVGQLPRKENQNVGNMST